MLQDILTLSAAAAGGANNTAEAFNKMGFSHMFNTFITGENNVGAIVFTTLVIMSMVRSITWQRISSKAALFQAVPTK